MKIQYGLLDYFETNLALLEIVIDYFKFAASWILVFFHIQQAPACILIKLSGVNCGKEFFRRKFPIVRFTQKANQG